MAENIRNIAIIAHVDHGKTTLVDRLLQQAGMLDRKRASTERVLDSNDLERERGITILSKSTAVNWNGYRINIVDTPGHADFGGEVERILSMVDSVLLLVDAVDGPMPQTRFVTQKAFAQGLKPIVVINKVDRAGARPNWVIDRTFDMFDRLGASDEQLDFPILYASALLGYAYYEGQPAEDMRAIFETIIERVPPPQVALDAPLQMQISSLDYSPYVGAIGIGRITRGTLLPGSAVAVVDRQGSTRAARVLQVLGFEGLERHQRQQALAGDIVAITGIEDLRISDTLCHPDHPQALPPLAVDEPTVSIQMLVNDSPFAGQDGKYVTSRRLNERLQQELIHNVALRVTPGADANEFIVAGRGELHLAVLLENMRREGYEMSVGRPNVITKMVDGKLCEPLEQLTVDAEAQYQGAIMEALGERRGELQDMANDGHGRVRLDYLIPARGLIGFRTEFLTLTSGTGLLYHTFDRYAPMKPGELAQRRSGVMISKVNGKSLAYALFNLQERGRMFIGPGEMVYEGMIVGNHARGNDLVVNPSKAKQLTNVRAAGSDENILLTPPVRHDLEQALEFIDDDELVEITPKAIRLRKRLLQEHQRKRASRAANIA